MIFIHRVLFWAVFFSSVVIGTSACKTNDDVSSELKSDSGKFLECFNDDFRVFIDPDVNHERVNMVVASGGNEVFEPELKEFTRARCMNCYSITLKLPEASNSILISTRGSRPGAPITGKLSFDDSPEESMDLNCKKSEKFYDAGEVFSAITEATYSPTTEVEESLLTNLFSRSQVPLETIGTCKKQTANLSYKVVSFNPAKFVFSFDNESADLIDAEKSYFVGLINRLNVRNTSQNPEIRQRSFDIQSSSCSHGPVLWSLKYETN